MSAKTRKLILFIPVATACVLSFTFGYFVGARRDKPINESPTSQAAPAPVANADESRFPSTDNSEHDSSLATIEDAIHPNDWLTAGASNTSQRFPSSIVACTPEDIFGSREAYLKMFNDSNEEVASEHDPFGVTRDDNLSKAADDQ